MSTQRTCLAAFLILFWLCLLFMMPLLEEAPRIITIPYGFVFIGAFVGAMVALDPVFNAIGDFWRQEKINWKRKRVIRELEEFREYILAEWPLARVPSAASLRERVNDFCDSDSCKWALSVEHFGNRLDLEMRGERDRIKKEEEENGAARKTKNYEEIRAHWLISRPNLPSSLQTEEDFAKFVDEEDYLSRSLDFLRYENRCRHLIEQIDIKCLSERFHNELLTFWVDVSDHYSPQDITRYENEVVLAGNPRPTEVQDRYEDYLERLRAIAAISDPADDQQEEEPPSPAIDIDALRKKHTAEVYEQTKNNPNISDELRAAQVERLVRQDIALASGGVLDDTVI